MLPEPPAASCSDRHPLLFQLELPLPPGLPSARCRFARPAQLAELLLAQQTICRADPRRPVSRWPMRLARKGGAPSRGPLFQIPLRVGQGEASVPSPRSVRSPGACHCFALQAQGPHQWTRVRHSRHRPTMRFQPAREDRAPRARLKVRPRIQRRMWAALQSRQWFAPSLTFPTRARDPNLPPWHWARTVWMAPRKLPWNPRLRRQACRQAGVWRQVRWLREHPPARVEPRAFLQVMSRCLAACPCGSRSS
jgi:hypothetical protein